MLVNITHLVTNPLYVIRNTIIFTTDRGRSVYLFLSDSEPLQTGSKNYNNRETTWVQQCGDTIRKWIWLLLWMISDKWKCRVGAVCFSNVGNDINVDLFQIFIQFFFKILVEDWRRSRMLPIKQPHTHTRLPKYILFH